MTMNGPFWHEQRRYAVQMFKEFAFTHKTLEHHIQVSWNQNCLNQHAQKQIAPIGGNLYALAYLL